MVSKIQRRFIRPMLAYQKLPDLNKLTYPILASPKLNGVRALVVDGKLQTRNGKLIPNRFLQEKFGADPELQGCDGELILGDPTDPDVWNKTVSAVMSHDGEPKVTYHIFDVWNSRMHFAYRNKLVKFLEAVYDLAGTGVAIVPHHICDSPDEVLAFEQKVLAAGYEGVILRSPKQLYKHGRSTLREEGMLKLKRFNDSEAKIVGFEELQHNENFAEQNSLGYTERSTHMDSLVGGNTLGAFTCVDLYSGVQFSLGTGFTAQQRKRFWETRSDLTGKIVKYKYFPVGIKDKPLHPVFLGFRPLEDL